MSSTIEPPEQLRADTIEARIIRKKVWRACNVENQHFMGALVGREGSGKSITGLKIAEAADPSFNAKRVMFEPESFLKKLKEWKANNETQGKLVVADEAGVGVGVRTWYQKDQILFNQVLQVIRDENMGILFTLPRLTELDSQARGRLHAVLELVSKSDGNWAKVKWLDWDPSRDERDKIYRHYPTVTVDGEPQKIKRLKIGPPSEKLVQNYTSRKEKFQQELYQEAIDEMGDDDGDDDDRSVRDVADEILDNGLAEFVSKHNQTKQAFVNHQLIRTQYDMTHDDAKAVKSMVEMEVTEEELEKHA